MDAKSINPNDFPDIPQPAAPPTMNDSPAPSKHTILILDDEPNVIGALRRALRPDGYRMLSARMGEEALELLEREHVDLIITDQRMPAMHGIEFLNKVQLVQPDAVRIMLTGYAEPQTVVDAINYGRVYRFMTKPWKDGDLRLTIRHALEQHDLMLENRRLTENLSAQNLILETFNQELEHKVTERTEEVRKQHDELKSLYQKLDSHFLEVMHLFSGLLEMRGPQMQGHAERVASLSRKLAESFFLSEIEVRQIEIGATLHDIGKIGIPDEILAKPENKRSKSEKSLVRQHPEMGQALVMGIDALKSASLLIRHHHERIDGQGYPDHLYNLDIPIGSRIIAVADAYDNLTHSASALKQPDQEAALVELNRGAYAKLDAEILRHLTDILANAAKRRADNNQVRRRVKDLKKGMVLSQDLFSARGLLLMASETRLTTSLIEMILNFDQVEAIGPVFVYEFDLD